MFLILSLLTLAVAVSAYDYTRHNRSLVLHQRPVLTTYNTTRPLRPFNSTRPILITNYTRVQPAVTTVNTTTPMPAPAPRSLRRS
jgi:hypothetical protein